MTSGRWTRSRGTARHSGRCLWACCWLGDGWVMVGLLLEMGLVIASDAWRSKAQVLLPAAAPLAHPAGPAEPRHADAIAGGEAVDAVSSTVLANYQRQAPLGTRAAATFPLWGRTAEIITREKGA